MPVRKRTWKKADGSESTSWIVDVRDGQGHRERRQFDSRKEAEAFRISVEGQMQTGTFRSSAGKLTVKDAADRFLEYCAGRQQRGERMTLQNLKVMEGHVRNYICPDAGRHEGKLPSRMAQQFEAGIGGIRLAQLRGRNVTDFRDRLRDAGIGVVTARKIVGTLQRLRALLALADDDFRVKLAFASATGLRAGELHALRWRHLDFGKGEVTIETRVDAYGAEDVTKTAAGMRSVPLAQPLVVMLKAWKLRTRWKKPEDLVFPNRHGRYTDHNHMVKRKFLPLFVAAAAAHASDSVRSPEVPVRFNWHALRHFAVSCWIDAGLSPKTVQTFAGHSSLQVTMDRYGHLFKSDDHKKAMDAIAADMFR